MKIDEILATATPRPWRYSQSQGGKWFLYGHDNNVIVYPNVSATGRTALQREANDKLTALAVNAYEKQREVIRELVEKVEAAGCMPFGPPCLCPRNRTNDKAERDHVGECRELRAALAKAKELLK